jgi:hypothetical protein
MDELRGRGVLRSTNNPVADYAEYLVSRGLQLKLADKSTRGYDALDDQGHRYEIKSRRITPHNKSRQLSVIRGLEQQEFDFLAAVLFDQWFAVLAAWLIPFAVVRERAVYRKHVNGWVLHAPDSLREIPLVSDISRQVTIVASNE